MRTFLTAVVVLAAASALALVPSAASADPVICVVTGATHIGPYTIDPPDPCLL